MNSIPKRLATRRLFDHDKAKAAEEALGTLSWLILAGYFEGADRIARALLSPGPWRLSNQSPLLYQAWQHRLWLGEQLQQPAVALDGSEQAQLAADWLVQRRQPSAQASSPWALLSKPRPFGKKTAWDQTELAAILALVQPGNFGSTFNMFRHDAELVLGERARTGKLVDSFDHAAVADAIEQAARIAFPKEVAVFALSAAWPAAALDLHAGRRDAAVARLKRLLAGAPVGNSSKGYHLQLEWMLEPVFTDLLGSHALAPALGLDDNGVAAYLDAFASRSPATLTAAKPRAWKIVLREYAARIKEDGTAADALVGQLQCCEPQSKPLLRRARRGQLLNAAADDASISALESRLGTQLPPSYREFLLTSDGLTVAEFVPLLPAAEVDWFANLDASNAIETWNLAPDEASDEQYAVYGADQDCIHMRPRHLRSALQISASCDGDVLLLIPEVRFGAEWEAWFLGNRNPGAYRYRSFRELMEQRVLAEEG